MGFPPPMLLLPDHFATHKARRFRGAMERETRRIGFAACLRQVAVARFWIRYAPSRGTPDAAIPAMCASVSGKTLAVGRRAGLGFSDNHQALMWWNPKVPREICSGFFDPYSDCVKRRSVRRLRCQPAMYSIVNFVAFAWANAQNASTKSLAAAPANSAKR